jgi:hypothetical protein
MRADMHYWNKQNFEGLLKLSEELDAYPDLRPLASYCRFREQGLRREAFSALKQFLLASRSFSNSAARSAAVEILEADARTLDAHQFLSQPLLAQFLIPTLRAWMDDEPATNIPVRWLGMLSRDNDLLSRALDMCAEDTPVRKRLIERQLYRAYYATHHLNESRLLGSIDEVMTDLARARDLIASAPDPEALAAFTSEMHYFDSMIADWIAFSKGPEGSFPEWCAKQGKEYSYPVRIYYKS